MAMVGTRGLLHLILAQEEIGVVIKLKISLLACTLLNLKVVMHLLQGEADIIVENIMDTQKECFSFPSSS